MHSKNCILCKVHVIQLLLSALSCMYVKQHQSLTLTFHILCPLQSSVGPAMEPRQKLLVRNCSFIQAKDVVRVRLFFSLSKLKLKLTNLASSICSHSPKVMNL